MNKETVILMGFSEEEVVDLIAMLEAYRLNVSNDVEANKLQDRFIEALKKIQGEITL